MNTLDNTRMGIKLILYAVFFSISALVGSLAMGMTFLLSPISGILTVLLGIRMTAVLGGSIATAGMVLSSFFVNNLDVLYFTYGIMYGLGASFAYTPSLAILGHYFKKYLSLVNGIVTIGSSVFTVVMPPIMEGMISNFGLPGLFRLLGFFAFCMALCGLLFKPIPAMVLTSNKQKGFKPLFLSIVNVHIWKSRRYMFWSLAMPVALWGYFVPYVHIKKFIQYNYSNVNENLPLQCIAAGSGVGRLFFGWIGDRPRVDKILLQQVAFYVIGVSTILLPFVNNFGVLVAIALFMGLFDGAFISLIGPVAIELCGAAYAAQGIGCMLGLAAPAMSIGPPVAGYLYRLRESYTLPFVVAGVTSIVGSTIMFAVRFYPNPSIRNTTNGIATHPTDLRIGKFT